MNLRARPETGAPVLGQVTRNQRVRVLATPVAGWVQIVVEE